MVTDDSGGQMSADFGIPCARVAFGSLIGARLAGFAFDFCNGYNLPIVASAISSAEAASIIAGTARARIPSHQKGLP